MKIKNLKGGSMVLCSKLSKPKKKHIMTCNNGSIELGSMEAYRVTYSDRGSPTPTRKV
jgi:hypothetical protein